MSDLVPEGWKFSSIGECCKILDSKRVPLNSEERAKRLGNYPYYGANGIQGYVDSFIFDCDAILVAEDGGNFDQYAERPIAQWVTGKYWVNNHAHIIRANENNLHKWIYYCLVHKNILKFINGGTRSKLNQSDLREIQIPIPTLSEQKKITSILTSVDEVIENTQKQIDKLQDLKKATTNELLTKGIGHTEFKDSELGRIPKSWEVLFLSDTKNENDRYSFTGGPFGSNLKNCDFTKNGVRIIQLQNIGDGSFLNEYKIYTSSKKADELISCNIYPGDIILSKMGDPVARATIIPDIETRYLMSSDGIRLSINKKKYDLKFILESINHQSTRNQAKVLSIGSTRQRISLTDIRKLLIRVPQLDEQKKISSVINSIDLRIKKINQKLVKTKLLKKSLMQELLTGKVRVSVN